MKCETLVCSTRVFVDRLKRKVNKKSAFILSSSNKDHNKKQTLRNIEIGTKKSVESAYKSCDRTSFRLEK